MNNPNVLHVNTSTHTPYSVSYRNRYQRWTRHEEDVVTRLHQQGQTHKSIGYLLGRTPEAVGQKIRNLKLEMEDSTSAGVTAMDVVPEHTNYRAYVPKSIRPTVRKGNKTLRLSIKDMENLHTAAAATVVVSLAFYMGFLIGAGGLL